VGQAELGFIGRGITLLSVFTMPHLIQAAPQLTLEGRFAQVITVKARLFNSLVFTKKLIVQSLLTPAYRLPEQYQLANFMEQETHEYIKAFGFCIRTAQ
jgi:hypothetical protein